MRTLKQSDIDVKSQEYASQVYTNSPAVQSIITKLSEQAFKAGAEWSQRELMKRNK